jgi:hypothetical protein
MAPPISTINNISKYVQLNDFLLLEYEFNRDSLRTALNTPTVAQTSLGGTYFFEGNGALGVTNNVLTLNSVPLDDNRSSWYIDTSVPYVTYPAYWDASTQASTTTYPVDTVKVHIVSGYNFDDVAGFLLQIRADGSNGLVDLANFSYIKQSDILNGGVIQFASNTLFLGNRFYDKYIEFEIPSVQALGNQTLGEQLELLLDVTQLSDVYLTYSTIFSIVNDNYVLDEKINVQLPVTSVADQFNCFIAESTEGDYIEYYATWDNLIIGNYMGDIESGRIKLYTSNNPNDNYQSFTDAYGTGAAKWVLIHEISVYEHIPGGTSLLTQKYSFTQDTNFSVPNYFRPILTNSDIDSSYSIQYTCRLNNRMDGTQIIRKASFSSTDPKKYGIKFDRLNVDNLLPYKVFNRIESEAATTINNVSNETIKYVKVFFDTVNVTVNEFNEVFPAGTAPLFLKPLDSTYKFKFEQIDSQGNSSNVDLSGVFNYVLSFKLDDNSKIEISPTFSTNMNTTLGELEFMISEDQSATLKKQSNNQFSIMVKNPNGSSSTLYPGVYYDIANQTAVLANYQNLFNVTALQTEIANLQAQVNTLTAANAALQTK